MILKRLQEGKSQRASSQQQRFGELRSITNTTTRSMGWDLAGCFRNFNGCFGLLAASAISVASPFVCAAAEAPVSEAAPTVIELFTSEGCSSCPPADRLLSELSRDKRRSVIALSEHVDYWDYLGWKDPNSSRAFSDRQNLYAHKMRLASVYTPQVVVNGVAEAVGNNRASIEDAISKTVDERLKRLLVRCQLSPDRRSVKIEVEPFPLARATNAFIANLALTADGVRSKVVRGENSGHTLLHDNVVVKLSSQAVSQPTFAQSGLHSLIAVPDNIDLIKTKVVVFFQDPCQGRIFAAGIGYPTAR